MVVAFVVVVVVVVAVVGAFVVVFVVTLPLISWIVVGGLNPFADNIYDFEKEANMKCNLCFDFDTCSLLRCNHAELHPTGINRFRCAFADLSGLRNLGTL